MSDDDQLPRGRRTLPRKSVEPQSTKYKACPICGKYFANRSIEAHADRCASQRFLSMNRGSTDSSRTRAMKGRKRAYRKRSHVASSDEEDKFTPSSTQKAVTEAPTSRKKRSAKEATFASSATTRRRREQTASPSSDGNTSGLNENAASVNERPVVIVCGGLKSWTLPDNTDVLKFRNGPVLYAKALSPSSPTSALSGGHPDPWVSAGSKADEKLLKLPVDAVIVTSAKGVEDKKRTASLVARLRYERKQLERFRSGKRKVRKKAGAMDQDSLSSSSPYASSEESLSHGVRRRHALEEGARTHNLRETKRSRTHSFKANHAEELQLVMKVKVLEGGGFQCEHIFPKSTNEIDKAQHPPGAKTEMEFSSIARHSHTDSSSGIAESMAAAALGARQRSQSQQKTLASNGRTAKTASKVFVPFVYSDSSDSDEDVPVRRRRSRLPASLTVSPPSKSHEARSLSLQSGSFEDSQEAIANKEAVEFIERMRDVHMICPEKYAQFVTLVRECKSLNMPARTVALKVHALLSDYPDLVHDFNTFLPIEERSLREHLPHSKSMLTSVENRLVAMNMLSSQVAPIQSGSKVQSRDIRRDENAQMRPTDLIECKQGGIDSMPKQISRESLALARHRSSTAMSTSPEQQLSSLPQFKAVQAAHMLRPRNGGFQVERRVLYEQLNAMGNNNNGAMYPSHLRANQHASAAYTLPPLPARVPQYLPPSHSLHPAPAPPNTVHRPWPRSGGPPTPQGAVHLEIPRSLHTRGSPTTTASTSGGSFRGRQVVGAHGEFPSNAQGGPNSAYAQSLMRNHLMAHDGAVATGSSGGGLEANHFHRLAGVRGSPSVISHGATVDCRGSVMSDTTRSGVAERAYPMPHSHIDHASGSVAAKGSANEQGLSGQQLPLPTRGECGPSRRPPRAPRAQRALAPAAAGATRLASEMLIRPVPSGNQRKALGRERKQSADGVRDTRSIGPSSPPSPLSRSKQPCRVPDDRVPHSTGPSAELRLRQVSAYHDACSFKQPIGDDKSHATAFDGTSVVDTSLSSSKQAKMETPPSSSLEDKHRIAPGIFWASDDEVDEFEDLEQGGFGGSERKIDQNEPEYEDDFFPSTSRTWSQDNISNGEEEASDAEMEIVEESASMARDASLHPDLGIPESGLATDKKFQNVDTCRAQLDKYVSYGALQKPKSGNAQKDTFAYSSNQMDMRGASAIKKVSAPPSKPRFLADSATMHKPLAHESGAASHSALTRHDSAQPYSALTRYTKSATQPVPASHAGTATQSGLKCLASATVQPSLTRRARAAPQPSLA